MTPAYAVSFAPEAPPPERRSAKRARYWQHPRGDGGGGVRGGGVPAMTHTTFGGEVP